MLKKHKGLLTTHLNIRSIWNKIDLIRTNFTNSSIDIITFSETWLLSDKPDELIYIQGYNVLRNDRKWSDDEFASKAKKGSGVCSFIKDSLNYKTNVIPDWNVSTKDLECQNFEISFENQKNVLIINLYRPPTGNVETFVNIFDTALQNIDLLKKDVILLGDFNIDFLDKSSKETKNVNRLVSEYGLTKRINCPTRYGATKDSCIDQIITNSNHILEAGVADINISDHQLIYYVKKKGKDQTTKTSFKGRSYRNYDLEIFKNLLDDQNWDRFQQNEDPNILWDIMSGNIENAIDDLCPLKTFKIKKYKEPWITQELLELIKQKDVRLKKAKRTKSVDDWNVAKRLRNDCLARIRRAKADFVKSELGENMKDSKKFWKNIKEILPLNNKSIKKFLLINNDTNENVQEEATAGYINRFFTNIGPNLAATFTKPWYYEGLECDKTIDDIVATRDEVLKLCKDIDVNKSSCINNVSTRVMKDALLHLIDKFTLLINKSLSSGIFPDLWKCARVTPLYKGGSRNHMGNFRPVSLLPLP